VNPANGGYPAWYQDGTGLDAGVLHAGEPGGTERRLVPDPAPDVPTGAAPETFPTNYSGEHFYWERHGGHPGRGHPGPLPGGRLQHRRPRPRRTGRFRPPCGITSSVPVTATTRCTPVRRLRLSGADRRGRLFFTSDIGIAAGRFRLRADSQIGTVLLPSATRGPRVAACRPTTTGLVTPYPGTGKLYLAVPARHRARHRQPAASVHITGRAVNRTTTTGFRIEVTNGGVPPSSSMSPTSRWSAG